MVCSVQQAQQWQEISVAKQIIQKLSLKAAGPDGLSNELLKSLPWEGIKELIYLVKEVGFCHLLIPLLSGRFPCGIFNFSIEFPNNTAASSATRRTLERNHYNAFGNLHWHSPITPRHHGNLQLQRHLETTITMRLAACNGIP